MSEGLGITSNKQELVHILFEYISGIHIWFFLWHKVLLFRYTYSYININNVENYLLKFVKTSKIYNLSHLYRYIYSYSAFHFAFLLVYYRTSVTSQCRGATRSVWHASHTTASWVICQPHRTNRCSAEVGVPHTSENVAVDSNLTTPRKISDRISFCYKCHPFFA